MQLRYEQLNLHLAKALAPVYFISGNEPFLIEDSRRTIHSAAYQQGFTEKQSWQIETGFSWQEFLTAANSMSLFSSKEIIELRCANNHLNEAAGKALQPYLANPSPDKILLIVTDKLTPQQQKASWYQTLLKMSVVMQIWPLEGAALTQWLRQRLAAVNLITSAQGLQLLAERAEGNLMAIAQEIEKLSLVYPTGNLTLEAIAEAVNDSARFDVFSLSDAFLQGNNKRMLRILASLKEEGIEPILILWALAKEIRTLATIAEQLAQGSNIEKILLEQRVWEKRKLLVRQAVQRHKLTGWHQLLQQAGEIDLMIKGLKPGNVWDALLALCLVKDHLSPRERSTRSGG